MLFNSASTSVLLCKAPCDMRKSIDGLSQLIAAELGSHPGDGRIYVFVNKARNKLKLIYWDKNGFCLWYKRLEKQRFLLPSMSDSTLGITPEQLGWLLSGLDIQTLCAFSEIKYKSFY